MMIRSPFALAFVLAVTACGTDQAPTSDCAPGETLACDCTSTSAGTMTRREASVQVPIG